MALLFIKQKLFPSWCNGNQRASPRDRYLKKNCSPSSDLSESGYPFATGTRIANYNMLVGRPLLPDSDNLDGSTVDGDSDRDVEAQTTSPYSTFASGPPEIDDETASSSTGTSTRSRIDPRLISDAILGLSDGLTVPFALSAGLSAIGDTKVVVIGGLAELTAGAISMGLGGYVGAKSEAYVFLSPLLFDKN